MKTQKITFAWIVVTLMLSVTIAQAGSSSSAGTGNPAASYCVEVGGTNEIYTQPNGGAESFCRIQSAVIDSWTLFRASREKASTDATNAFINHQAPTSRRISHRGNPVGLPNPASVYCIQVSGSLLIVKDATGGEMGACEFKDGSIIDEWTLFRGPDADGNKALASLLTGTSR